MKQRLTTAILIVALITTPVAAAVGPTGLSSVSDAQAGLFGYSAPDDAVQYGSDATLSWHVYTEDGTEALYTWANESDRRSVITSDNASNWAVVAAPPGPMGVSQLDRWLDNGLLSKSYVTGLTINRAVSTPDTPTSTNLSESAGVDTSRLERVSTFGDVPTDGIIQPRDVNATTTGDGRDVLGADNVSQTGAGVRIAVIDSGLNTANGTLGLEDNVVNASKDFVDSNETYEETVESDGYSALNDPNGHGSWVTSVIATDENSSVDNEWSEGVAPDAEILSLRALDGSGAGSTADIVAAIRYAEAHNADIISMSLGSQLYTPAMGRAIEDALAGNTTLVSIAAGNSRQTARWVASPADTPAEGVMTVAASNTANNSTAGIGSFSQLGNDPGTTDLSAGVTTGQQVDVAAPGIKVTARVATVDEIRYNSTLTGTSMSQPYLAAAGAQVLEAHPKLRNDSAALADRLRNTARPMQNAATAEAGHGLLAADRAIADETSGSQAEAMDDAAQARNKFWESLGSGPIVRIQQALGV